MEKYNFIRSLLKEVNDYSELTLIQFYIKYCLSTIDLHDIRMEYKGYKRYDIEGDDYDYNEWLEKIYFNNHQDEILDSIIEYKEPYSIEEFKSDYHSIYDLLLAGGGPNITLRIDTKYQEIILYYNNETEDLSKHYEKFILFYNNILGDI